MSKILSYHGSIYRSVLAYPAGFRKSLAYWDDHTFVKMDSPTSVVMRFGRDQAAQRVNPEEKGLSFRRLIEMVMEANPGLPFPTMYYVSDLVDSKPVKANYWLPAIKEEQIFEYFVRRFDTFTSNTPPPRPQRWIKHDRLGGRGAESRAVRFTLDPAEPTANKQFVEDFFSAVVSGFTDICRKAPTPFSVVLDKKSLRGSLPKGGRAGTDPVVYCFVKFEDCADHYKCISLIEVFYTRRIFTEARRDANPLRGAY